MLIFDVINQAKIDEQMQKEEEPKLRVAFSKDEKAAVSAITQLEGYVQDLPPSLLFPLNY